MLKIVQDYNIEMNPSDVQTNFLYNVQGIKFEYAGNIRESACTIVLCMSSSIHIVYPTKLMRL